MPKNQEQLKKLKARLAELDTRAVATLGSAYDSIRGYTEQAMAEEAKKAVATVRETAPIKAIEALARDFDAFKGNINLKPIIEAVNRAEIENNERFSATESAFQDKLVRLVEALNIRDSENKSFSDQERKKTLLQIKTLTDSLDTERTASGNRSALLQSEMAKLSNEVKGILTRLGNVKKDKTGETLVKVGELTSENSKQIQSVQEEVRKLERDILSRIGRIRGGGNANRQILVDGNSSTLGRYTDINLIPGSNMGIAVAENQSTGRTDMTIYSTGGGGPGDTNWLTVKEIDDNPTVGSVKTIRVSNGTLTDDGGGQVTITTSGGASGITRSTSIITANTTGGNTASTDYVYFVNAGITFTLPTAVGNNNAYAVKNMSASSVLVATSAGQSIDDGATALLGTQYEEITMISNGSVWGIFL